ncbi:hypothetical protein ACHQM5_002398 [Ranunculus cassubicifolius]
MNSMSSNKLPAVNISQRELKPGTSSWCSIRTQVRQALQEYGCFEAVFIDFSQDLHTAMFEALKDLFDLPAETKSSNNLDEPFQAYNGSSPHMPLSESMAINHVLDTDRLQAFTNLMWPPHGSSDFCESVQSFVSQVADVEQMVKRMVFESFGVADNFDSMQESSCYLLRVMKYRAPQMNENSLGFITHTDLSFVTILCQNDVNGLEIQTRDGEWISVMPSASSFVVIIGDAFMAWSNGRLYSPPHRVVMNEGETRYSMGLFSFSKSIVQIPEQLVDEEHPLLFKPFDNIGLRHFVRSEQAQKVQSGIKAYCGL